LGLTKALHYLWPKIISCRIERKKRAAIEPVVIAIETCEHLGLNLLVFHLQLELDILVHSRTAQMALPKVGI
jgi:hypothetical protein